ncbi:MAG: methyltransferase domain-containing protein [Deltaproteobacteria bacterium]|nr:methyltransferase domain-containing protein [Deltaproteobacteria bacterium]
MGFVFDFQTSKAYESWCRQTKNQTIISRETRLMGDLLTPLHGSTVLDIGCGPGFAMEAFKVAGLNATGLDASPYMLDFAVERLGKGAELHRGIAEDLPFEDNAFNFACITKTLEFVDSPEKALSEAFRVTKDRVFIGILNRHALAGIQNRSYDQNLEAMIENSRFFSLWEIKKTIRELVGKVPVTWQALWHLQRQPGKINEKLEDSQWLKQIPFGVYIGIAVTLCPKYRAKPLSLNCTANQGTGAFL